MKGESLVGLMVVLPDDCMSSTIIAFRAQSNEYRIRSYDGRHDHWYPRVWVEATFKSGEIRLATPLWMPRDRVLGSPLGYLVRPADSEAWPRSC